MKVIRSNPWGFGIHSPFVYHLVTRVIFGNGISLSEKVPGIFDTNRRLKRKAELILRLARYFDPEVIVLEEKNDDFTQYLRNLLSFKEIKTFAELTSQKAGTGLELVIGATSGFFQDAIPGNTGSAVWILTRLEDFEMRTLFNKLRLSKKVSLTTEVNKTGIVIFNHNFRKQNYVIRRFCFF